MDFSEFYHKHKVCQEKKWLEYNLLHPQIREDSFAEDYEIILEMIDKLSNLQSFIDIGCGSLDLLRSLKGRIANLYGIDIVEYTIWKNEPDIITKVVNVNQEGIPFSDSTFDCVTMVATLEHLFDPFEIVREVYRVLRPGGYFIFSVPNIAGIKHRIDLLMGKLPVTSSNIGWQEMEWDGGHLHYFTLKSIKWLLVQDTTFKIMGVRGSGRFQLLKMLRPSFFSQDLIVSCVKT